MANEVFRKKSLDRISSPESLTEYIQVANPAVWLILAAIVLLLAGTCLWGILGRLDTVVKTTAIVKNGAAVCSVSAEDVTSISVGMPVKVDGAETEVTAISAAEAFGSYDIEFSAELADGVYSAEIVTERISPISLVMN